MEITRESSNDTFNTSISNTGPIHTASAFMANVVPATATTPASGDTPIAAPASAETRRASTTTRSPATAESRRIIATASAAQAPVAESRRASTATAAPTQAESRRILAAISAAQAPTSESRRISTTTTTAAHRVSTTSGIQPPLKTPSVTASGMPPMIRSSVAPAAGGGGESRKASVTDLPSPPAAAPQQVMPTSTTVATTAEASTPPPAAAASRVFSSPSTADFLNNIQESKVNQQNQLPQPQQQQQQHQRQAQQQQPQHIQYTFDGIKPQQPPPTPLQQHQQQQSREEKRKTLPDLNKNESFAGKMMQRVQDKSKEFVSTQQKRINQMTAGKSTPDMAQAGGVNKSSPSNTQPVPIGRYHSNNQGVGFGGNNSGVIPTSKSPSFNTTLPPTAGGQPQQYSNTGGYDGRSPHRPHQKQHHKHSLNPFSKGDAPSKVNADGGAGAGASPQESGKKSHSARMSRAPQSGASPLPKPTPQPHYPATEDARYRLMLILAVFLGGWLLGSVIVAIHVSSFESDALVEVYARRLHYKDFPFNGTSIDEVDASARRQVATGGELFKRDRQETTTAATTAATTPVKKDDKDRFLLPGGPEKDIFEAQKAENILDAARKFVKSRQKRFASDTKSAAAKAKPQFDEGDWEGLDKRPSQSYAAAAAKPVDPKAAAVVESAAEKKAASNPKFDVVVKKKKSKRHWYGRKRKNHDGAALQFEDDDADDVQYTNPTDDFDVKKKKSKRHWYGRKRKNHDGAVIEEKVETELLDAPPPQPEDFDVKKKKSKRHWYGRKRKDRNGLAMEAVETAADFDDDDDAGPEITAFDVVRKKKSKRHWYGRKRKSHDGPAETAAEFDDDEEGESPDIMFEKKRGKRHWYGKKRKNHNGVIETVEFDDDEEESPDIMFEKKRSKRKWYGKKRKTGHGAEVVEFDDDEEGEGPDIMFEKRKGKRTWYGKKKRNGHGAEVAEFDDDEDDKYDANYDVGRKKKKRWGRRRKGRDSLGVQDVNAVIAPATTGSKKVNLMAAPTNSEKLTELVEGEEFDEEDEDPMQYYNIVKRVDFENDDEGEKKADVSDVKKKKHTKRWWKFWHRKNKKNKKKNADKEEEVVESKTVIKEETPSSNTQTHHESVTVVAAAVSPLPPVVAKKTLVSERIKRESASTYLDEQPSQKRRHESKKKIASLEHPPVIQIEQGKVDFDTKITFTVSNPDDEQRILEQVGVIAKQRPVVEDQSSSGRHKSHYRNVRIREEEVGSSRSDNNVEDTNAASQQREETGGGGGGDAEHSSGKDESEERSIEIHREDQLEEENGSGDNQQHQKSSNDRGGGDRRGSAPEPQRENQQQQQHQQQQQQQQREERHEQIASALIEQVAKQSSAASPQNSQKQRREYAREPLQRTSSSSESGGSETYRPSSHLIERRAQRVCHAQLRDECRNALERVNDAVEDLERNAGGIASVEFNTSIREVLDQIRRKLKYPFALALSLNSLLLVFALFFLFSHHLAEGIVQNMLLSTPAALLTPSRLGLRWQLGANNNKKPPPPPKGPPKPPGPPASAADRLNPTTDAPARPSGFFRNVYKNIQSRTSMSNINNPHKTQTKTRTPSAAASGPTYQPVPQTEQQANMKNDTHKYNRQPNVMDNGHDGDTTTDDDEAPINVVHDINTDLEAQQRPSMHGAMTRQGSRVPLAQMTGEPSSGSHFAAPTLGGTF